MEIVVWVLQILLAVAFLGAGVMKLVRPKPALVSSGMAWAEDYSDDGVKGIGALEVLGAIGLILPAVTGIATILSAAGRGRSGAGHGRGRGGARAAQGDAGAADRARGARAGRRRAAVRSVPAVTRATHEGCR